MSDKIMAKQAEPASPAAPAPVPLDLEMLGRAKTFMREHQWLVCFADDDDIKEFNYIAVEFADFAQSELSRLTAELEQVKAERDRLQRKVDKAAQMFGAMALCGGNNEFGRAARQALNDMAAEAALGEKGSE